MPLNVHLHQEKNQAFIANLKTLLDDGINLTWGDLLPEPANCHILVSGVPDKEIIESCTNLKYLLIPWAGLPRATRKLMLDYPHIAVHNIHHNALPAAEMAILLMLASAKNIISIDSAFRKHDWSMRYIDDCAGLVSGKKALIVGYGSIGRIIASRCLAFDMDVSAINRSGKSPEDCKIKVFPPSELDNLLPRTDVLFLSLPLTDSTKGLIGKRRLSMLPEGAIVINISRGRIIDEKALYEILKSGKIKAGLDVWYNYPDSIEDRKNRPPSQFPFHELPNVIMTPHMAENTDRTEMLRAMEIARLLNMASRGEPLPNSVDVISGY
ncbi:MAG: hydroxyacid dehydrogenase [Candidatus Zixiibacteriota bacterium]|nr:MAG: hydroxyacid dehydrogenase [candidate division Zixibacteria bacterium]